MPLDFDLADLRVVGYEQKGLLSELVTALHELADQLANAPAPTVNIPTSNPTIQVEAPLLDLSGMYELMVQQQRATSRVLEEIKEIVKDVGKKPAAGTRFLGGGPSTLKLERPDGTTGVWDAETGGLRVFVENQTEGGGAAATAPVTTLAATVTLTGPTTLLTPAAGSKVRVRWLFAQSDPENAGTVVVTFRLGGTIVYRFELDAGQPFAHSTMVDGAVDAPLTVELSNTNLVYVNADYEEV